MELEKLKNDLKLSRYYSDQVKDITLFGYWEMDLKSGAVRWSEDVYKIFKIKTKKKEPCLDYFLSFVHPDDLKVVSDIIAKALNDKKNYSFLCRLLLKKNEVITVYIQAKFGFKEKKTPQILYGIVQDVTEMKKMQNELCISEMIGQEKERSRISKDLHDGVGQMLLATNLNLISITNAAKKKDEALAKRLEETISTMQTIIQEVRDISHNMAPCVLKNRGLPFSIRTICETTFKKHHISFSFHSNLKKHLPELQQTVLFRIFQEISTNIIKHAQCSKVDISLFKKRNKVQLIVEDNGKGIEINLEKHKKDGIGLEGIKNRVELLNGDFKINSQKNKGARIEISIPC